MDSSSKQFLLPSPSLINEDHMKHITGHRLEFVKVEPSKSTETRQYSAFSGHDCDPSLALQPPNPRTRNDIGYLLQILGPKMKTSPEFRESCDAYCRVIAGNQAYRVIICRDGIQFIIQKAVGRDSSITGREWRGISYHRQRASLIRRVEEICGRTLDEIFDRAGSEIAKLPEICRGYGHVRKTGGVSI